MTLLAPLSLLFGGLALPILALYFLKRKRRPVRVSSTWLWEKAVRDLQVNTPFQRIRASLLLILQILLVVLGALTLARPAFLASGRGGEALILLIDRSASMAATDVKPSRLEKAKAEAVRLIEAAGEEDQVMVIAFSNRAEVLVPFTADRREAVRAIDGIRPAMTPTAIREALQMAVSSAAQLGKARKRIVVLSDGHAGEAGVKSRDIPIQFVPIGGRIRNVAITAVDVRRPVDPGDPLTVFARLDNFGPDPVQGRPELYLNGRLVAVRSADLPANGGSAVVYRVKGPVPEFGEVRLPGGDDLAADDRAWFVVPHEETSVLLVGPRDFFLEQAVAKYRGVRLSRVDFGKFDPRMLAGVDVAIFKGAAPDRLPEGRYLFIDAVPPWAGFKVTGRVKEPLVVDWNSRHPVTRRIDFSGLLLEAAARVKAPDYARALVEMREGPLLLVWEKAGVRGAWMTFDPLRSDWPLRLSYPLCIGNLIEYLRAAPAEGAARAGDPLRFRLGPSETRVEVEEPGGGRHVLSGPPGTVVALGTEKVGTYRIRRGDRVELVPVNLFDPSESSGRVAKELKLAEGPVVGQAAVPLPRREYWSWVAWGMLLILAAEWFLYHRRP